MPNPGALRFNTDSQKLELFDGNQWTEIVASSPDSQTGGARGVFGGGYSGVNTIDYVTISTTGNSIDFGDLLTGRAGIGAVASSTRGVFAGGITPTNVNTIEYITISITGNAQDFGDLTAPKQSTAECSNATRGVFVGGQTPSSGYILLLAALRISPSYELARKVRAGEVKLSEIKNLPKDFDQVLATYDLIGDVNKIVFRYWWLQRGIKIFGIPNTKPDLKVIDKFEYGEEFDGEYLNKNLVTYFEHERRNEGFPPALLLSIPLTLKRSEILKKINNLLDANKVHLDEPK